MSRIPQDQDEVLDGIDPEDSLRSKDTKSLDAEYDVIEDDDSDDHKLSKKIQGVTNLSIDKPKSSFLSFTGRLSDNQHLSNLHQLKDMLLRDESSPNASLDKLQILVKMRQKSN